MGVNRFGHGRTAGISGVRQRDRVHALVGFIKRVLFEDQLDQQHGFVFYQMK
jgi:hypothetical protein